MNTSKYHISDFSPHLFWHTDRKKLDFSTSRETIIYQVLEYGMMSDWILLQKIYTKEVIKEVVLNLRQMDPVTLSFISNYLKVDKSVFRCYKNSQSEKSFWNSWLI
jgi:hypothetical protein